MLPDKVQSQTPPEHPPAESERLDGKPLVNVPPSAFHSVSMLKTSREQSAAWMPTGAMGSLYWTFCDAGLTLTTGSALDQHSKSPKIVMLSTRQPVLETLLSAPKRQRNWTLCPAAEAGRRATVVM